MHLSLTTLMVVRPMAWATWMTNCGSRIQGGGLSHSDHAAVHHLLTPEEDRGYVAQSAGLLLLVS